MSITNGFDLSRVLPIMKARKGWQQPTQADFTPVLDTANTTCTSGMFYNYDHSACDPMTIWSVQPDSNISDVNFNAYLDKYKQQIAMNSLNAVFRESAVIESPKILFEKQFRTGYTTITNANKFCGWQVKIAQGDYSAKIDSIALMFDKACTVTIYVFNDLLQAPIWQQEFTVTTGYNQEIFNIDDLILNRLNNTNKGGVFFVGYFQAEVEAQDAKAVDVYLNNFAVYNIIGYQQFEATSDYNTLWFRRDMYYANFRTYGVNLEISTYYDHTNTIIRNAYAFDRLQGLMMTFKCIEDTVYSNRSNIDQRISAENFDAMLTYLNGGSVQRGDSKIGRPSKASLGQLIEQEVDRVRKTFYDNTQMVTAIPPVNEGDVLNSFTFGRPII